MDSDATGSIMTNRNPRACAIPRHTLLDLQPARVLIRILIADRHANCTHANGERHSRAAASNNVHIRLRKRIRNG